jgi:hypothetical protein
VIHDERPVAGVGVRAGVAGEVVLRAVRRQW